MSSAVAHIFFMLKRTNVYQCSQSVTSMVFLKVYVPCMVACSSSASQEWLYTTTVMLYWIIFTPVAYSFASAEVYY